MEDKTYGTLVTDCGIQLIAAAVMEGKKINITDLAVGDGGGSYYKPNSTMTALKGEKWRGMIFPTVFTAGLVTRFEFLPHEV